MVGVISRAIYNYIVNVLQLLQSGDSTQALGRVLGSRHRAYIGLQSALDKQSIVPASICFTFLLEVDGKPRVGFRVEGLSLPPFAGSAIFPA